MTIHTFDSLEALREALRADNATDYTVSDKTPRFVNGDMVDVPTRFGDRLLVVSEGKLYMPGTGWGPRMREEADALGIGYLERGEYLTAASRVLRQRQAEKQEADRRNKAIAARDDVLSHCSDLIKMVDGKVVWVHDNTQCYDFMIDYRGSTWTGSNMLVARVGTYGNRHRFPQKKDGTFSYDKISAALRGVLERRAARERAERDRETAYTQQRSNASVLTDELKAALRPFYPTASSDPEKPVRLDIRIAANFTVDRAKEVVAGLRALGLIQ